MSRELSGGLPANLAGSRDFEYVRPHGRKLSEYEAVTCYIQPATRGGGLQLGGDFFLRPDGRPVFDPDESSVKVSDWFSFRDPNQMWQRRYYAEQSRAERFLDAATETFLTTRAFEAVERNWLERGLGEAYLAFAHVEYGLFRAFNSAVREAMSDTVSSVILFNGADKLRHAQAIAILSLDLEGVVEGFDGTRGRHAWLGGEPWEPVRLFLEQLMATRDWCEIVIGVNAVFEPLIGDPLRRVLFSAGAARHGDTLTPVVSGTATRDWQRNARWTTDFIRFVVSEGEPANERVIADWLHKWTCVASGVADRLFAQLEQALDVRDLCSGANLGRGQQEAIVGLESVGNRL
jgi:hypothetical protein